MNETIKHLDALRELHAEPSAEAARARRYRRRRRIGINSALLVAVDRETARRRLIQAGKISADATDEDVLEELEMTLADVLVTS